MTYNIKYYIYKSTYGWHLTVTCLCGPAAHHFAILWASVGNTMPASFWALYYLISQKEALQAVRNELHQVLQLSDGQDPREADVVITKDHLDQLVYMSEFTLYTVE